MPGDADAATLMPTRMYITHSDTCKAAPHYCGTHACTHPLLSQLLLTLLRCSHAHRPRLHFPLYPPPFPAHPPCLRCSAPSWQILHSTEHTREGTALFLPGSGSITVEGCTGPLLTAGAVVRQLSTDPDSGAALEWTWRVVDAVNVPLTHFCK